jgi:hypothetical protein
MHTSVDGKGQSDPFLLSIGRFFNQGLAKCFSNTDGQATAPILAEVYQVRLLLAQFLQHSLTAKRFKSRFNSTNLSGMHGAIAEK